MSTETPRPERVSLTDEEFNWFSAWIARGALGFELADWLAARGQALREEIADEITAELICCDIYALLSEKPTKDWTAEEQSTYQHHSICYWGEASRRIVLKED